jgi:hypothetical protein
VTKQNSEKAFKEQERKTLSIFELDSKDMTGFTLWSFYSSRVVGQEAGLSQVGLDIVTKE